jgi:hypothetical protein
MMAKGSKFLRTTNNDNRRRSLFLQREPKKDGGLFDSEDNRKVINDSELEVPLNAPKGNIISAKLGKENTHNLIDIQIQFLKDFWRYVYELDGRTFYELNIIWTVFLLTNPFTEWFYSPFLEGWA